jgi:hypothetical protein
VECMHCLASLNLGGANLSADNDKWMCVICGFVGCGEQEQRHIFKHYEESLHAYAVNIRSRLVWDFAGGGYVHRLLISSDEDREHSHMPPVEHKPEAAGQLKVVEVVDPQSSSDARPTQPPLTSSQMQSKVDSVAAQLHQLLLWHLEKQRMQFESRISRVRGSSLPAIMQPGEMATSEEREANPSASWKQAVLQQMSVERSKIIKQKSAAQLRLQTVSSELETLRCLEGSLRENSRDWELKLQGSLMRVQEADQSSRYGSVVCFCRLSTIH